MMQHITEGTLRAYLDGELGAVQVERVAAHLRECAACRAQLGKLSAQSAMARQAVELLAPGASEAPLPAPVALARFKQAAAQSRSQFHLRADYSQKWQEIAVLLQEGVLMMFSKKFRPVWVTLTIVLVAGILLSFAPVRAAASQFLGLFRVRKFAVVPINPATLSGDHDNAAVQEQVAKMFSEDVTVIREPGDPVKVASVDEASRMANLGVRLPTTLGAPGEIEVQGGFELRYRFDAERARTLLEMMDRRNVQIPAGLDGAMIHVDVKPIVAVEFGADEEEFVLVQANSPIVDLPPTVDVNGLGEALLQLWGMSPDKARKVAAEIDWTSTLVIPLPENRASYQDVTVEGSPGLFIQERSKRGQDQQVFTLLWQKDDIVYALMGEGGLDHALEIANSMQ